MTDILERIEDLLRSCDSPPSFELLEDCGKEIKALRRLKTPKQPTTQQKRELKLILEHYWNLMGRIMLQPDKLQGLEVPAVVGMRLIAQREAQRLSAEVEAEVKAQVAEAGKLQ